MATPNYEINYDDERFQQVETDKQQAMSDLSNTYNNMITQSDKYYETQIQAQKDYANTQSQLQQENTDFTIEKIEQQKQQAEKDYTKEQKGAYVDWQKESNKYSANAETMAEQGLTNAGYSESSQVSMYNTYQNRVATARDSFNRAVLNYDNSIKEAQLANNSALAEIAFNSLQAQLELSLQGFQYKNQLLLDQINKKQELENTYYSRWQNVLNQINQENQFAESIRQYEQNYAENVRQYNESMAEQKRQFNQQQANWQKEYDLAKKQASGGSGGSISSKNPSGGSIDDKKPSNSQIEHGGGGRRMDEVQTDYYSGSLNPDTKYGTFKTTDKNGVRYQPNNVGGSKLSSTGLTIENNGVTQNVWKSAKGRYYYWEGRKNKYIEIPANKVKAIQQLAFGGAGRRM